MEEFRNSEAWDHLDTLTCPKLCFAHSQKDMTIEGEGIRSLGNKERVLENVIRQMIPITARLPAA